LHSKDEDFGELRQITNAYDCGLMT